MLLTLFWTFFKVGFFTFGGGYAMIPIIEREIVEKHQWLTLAQFTDLIAISEMTPGPISVNAATFVGYKLAKFFGSLAATLGLILPSFLVILVIASIFVHFQENLIVQAVFKGLRPAVFALIVVAAFSIGRACVVDIRGLILAGLVIFAIIFLKLNPILALIISGCIGVLFFR
ncbi:MAG: chromate transporter [Candidatus Omnitrophota bacterium]